MQAPNENDNNILKVEDKEIGCEETYRQASEQPVLSPAKEEKIVEEKQAEI